MGIDDIIEKYKNKTIYEIIKELENKQKEMSLTDEELKIKLRKFDNGEESDPNIAEWYDLCWLLAFKSIKRSLILEENDLDEEDIQQNIESLNICLEKLKWRRAHGE